MAQKMQKQSDSSTEMKEKSKTPPKKDSSLTKVIIRRLPPTMTESDLLEQVSPLPTYDYFSFVAADTSLAPWLFTRAYINFTNVEDVILFRDRFDGYVFVDARGNEYPAMVEMAPSTKVPKKKPKRDIKCNSLDDDPEYKKFVETLKNPEPIQMMTLEQCLEEIDKKEKERKEQSAKGVRIPTPLTEFIKQKKEEKVQRQFEKRRQRDEERRKRIEYERQMEKKRRQRELEKKEREAKKEAQQQRSSDVPPRFAKDDGGDGGAIIKERPPQELRQRPPRQRREPKEPGTYGGGGTAAAGPSGGGGAGVEKKPRPPKQPRPPRTDKGEGGGHERHGKGRYKDRPAVAIYQAGGGRGGKRIEEGVQGEKKPPPSDT